MLSGIASGNLTSQKMTMVSLAKSSNEMEASDQLLSYSFQGYSAGAKYGMYYPLVICYSLLL